jgi:prolyl-tRNA synthetase
MKQSKLFTKTEKSQKAFDSKNATLLTKGGFIEIQFAGVYNYLPLGLRVLNKISKIVREEMDQISNEILMPSLSLQELWQKTNRLENVDVLMKTTGANELSKQKNTTEYILQGTHEETVTPLVQKFVQSYKDLPIAVYQIQTKFRNEARAKSGILRGREFLMKDLYSFHQNEADLKSYYEITKQAYTKVFERLGFKLNEDLFIALASGGDFTPDFSHEFQVKIEIGEDILFRVPSSGVVYNKEVAPSKAVDVKSESPQEMKEVYGENIIGVDELVEFLKVPIERCVKTLIYETNTGEIVAVAIRGDYEVNEIKLSKILNCSMVKLASPETVLKFTGTKIGYAGILNLNSAIRLICDDSIENLTNFETGSNKENYHIINVNWDRDVAKPQKFFDVKMAKEKDLYPETGECYEVFRASEVGNIFPLNTKFSQSFDFTYQDEKGESQIVYMGCYGIGISRLMGVIVEKFNDERGIVWPASIAPFQIHLISLSKSQTEEPFIIAENLYRDLVNKGFEVLFDDRFDKSAGEKFADADLIGIPTRIVVSSRTLEQNQVEVKHRSSNDIRMVKLSELLDIL